MSLGATDYVSTNDKHFAENWKGKIDLIIVIPLSSAASTQMLIFFRIRRTYLRRSRWRICWQLWRFTADVYWSPSQMKTFLSSKQLARNGLSISYWALANFNFKTWSDKARCWVGAKCIVGYYLSRVRCTNLAFLEEARKMRWTCSNLLRTWTSGVL